MLLQVELQLPTEADLLARRIARALAEPFTLAGQDLTIGASVGYALYPQHGVDLDELIARADEALIGVKQRGGGVAVYRPTEVYAPRRWSA